MRILGLTGGIATGKSTVSNILRAEKFPIVDADLIAREVVEPGTPGYRQIVSAFGTTVLQDETNPNSPIDRAKLGTRVFSDPDARAKVNAATHPYIRLEMLRQLLWHFLTGCSAVILDTPLLFEAHISRWVHLIIVVYVPKQLQKDRLISRDGIDRTSANQRIDSQMDIEAKKQLAHVVIDNTGSREETRDNVMAVLPKLRPSRVVSAVVWVALFWPAAVCYSGLSVYRWLKI
ncbi:hypothetical protein HDU81_008891 [Chytriomyces hyalinus]|nr:hypothetical protein HDU81_008891 [Chytriomyces hyalinus]